MRELHTAALAVAGTLDRDDPELLGLPLPAGVEGHSIGHGVGQRDGMDYADDVVEAHVVCNQRIDVEAYCALDVDHDGDCSAVA